MFCLFKENLYYTQNGWWMWHFWAQNQHLKFFSWIQHDQWSGNTWKPQKNHKSTETTATSLFLYSIINALQAEICLTMKCIASHCKEAWMNCQIFLLWYFQTLQSWSLIDWVIILRSSRNCRYSDYFRANRNWLICIKWL